MKPDEIALQIMLKLMDVNFKELQDSFRSSQNQSGIVPEKVGEFYNALRNKIESADQTKSGKTVFI